MTWMKGGGRGLYRNAYMSEIKEIAYSYVRGMKNADSPRKIK